MSDLDEKEQIEELRAWWKEYGNYVLLGAAVVVVGYFGINAWQNSVRDNEVAASMLYDSLAEAADADRLEDAESDAAQLRDGYAGSPYAAQAQLVLARLYMDRNRDEDAATALRELVAGSGNDELRHVGRTRLGRILLYQEKPQEVLDLLDGIDESGFAARYAELRGDAHAALGDVEAARAAYLDALAGNAETINTGFVQLKLLDLPTATVAGDDPAADEAAVPAEETTADAGTEAAE